MAIRLFFIIIGLMPNKDLIRDQVETSPDGTIVTDKTLMTSQSGLFAAGDVRAGSAKQTNLVTVEGATEALMLRENLIEVG